MFVILNKDIGGLFTLNKSYYLKTK